MECPCCFTPMIQPSNGVWECEECGLSFSYSEFDPELDLSDILGFYNVDGEDITEDIINSTEI